MKSKILKIGLFKLNCHHSLEIFASASDKPNISLFEKSSVINRFNRKEFDFHSYASQYSFTNA